MTQPHLSQINIYPVKSTRGMSLSRSWIDKQGLSQDRRFMVAKVDGSMVTARTYPQLLKVKTNLLSEGLQLIYPLQENLLLAFSDFSLKPMATEVWESEFEAFHTSVQADQWFSSIIGEPVNLLFCGELPNRFQEDIQHAVGFVDEFPALLISEGSLQALNARSQRNNTMEQFRPNLVISNQEAFEEDGWKRIKIGEVIFDVVKACERCILTTAEIGDDKFNVFAEPLATLVKFRAKEDGGVFFGQNLKPLNAGMVQVGDVVEVLETQEKKYYSDSSTLNLNLKCVDRVQIANNFTTFYFESVNGVELPSYLPGQYLPICLNINGKSISRCYTLSSSPTQKNRYAISVKRVDAGVSSNWLTDHLQIGSTITAQNPIGEFHLNDNVDKLLLLSAGSGVTPMLSMLNFLADNKQLHDVVFYHQCQTQSDIPETALLERMAQSHPLLTIIISLTQAEESWQGIKGRFSNKHMALISELNERQVFVCGPNPFMDSVRTQLLEHGLPAQHYHQEAFAAAKADVGESKDVYICIDGKIIPATNQRTLLEHIESAGVKVHNSCRAGVCGSCKLTLLDGEVVQNGAGALSEQDIAAGNILACCSTPISDVELQSPKDDALK